MLQRLISAGEYSIEQVLSKAWRLYKDNFKLILKIIVVVYLPINIVLGMIPVGDTAEDARYYMTIVQTLEGLFGIVAVMAVTFVAKYKIDNKKIDFQKAFEKSFSRWWPVVWTNIVAGVFLLGLFLLLVVPGIIFSVYWIFIIYIAILFDKTGKEALDRSKAIVKGRWWTTFLYTLILTLLFFLAVAIGSSLTYLSGTYIFNLIIEMLLDVVGAYFMVAWTILFLNFDKTKKKAVK
ncbi:hypothetical protein HOB10_04655 [Candidatus Parcubacteria bacterium]|jgi:hypothetical protein|nr:hypothetical protein [Candidatus Parcubacteria bacterium]